MSLQKLTSRFASDQAGNFAIIYGLLATMMFGMIGVAIDYSWLSTVRSNMQGAADSAALVAASKSTLSDDNRKKLAADTFKANYTDTTDVQLDTSLTGNEARVTARTTVKNMLGSFFGASTTDVSVEAKAQGAIPSNLEIALALDVSGSMDASIPGSGSRLEALQSAISDMIDQLKSANDPTIKVGVVPFTMTVNVGPGNSRFVTGTNDPLFAGTAWRGCVFERPSPNTFKDVPGNWRAYLWPPMPNVRGSGDYNFNWVQSNGTNDGYASVREDLSSATGPISGPNYNCVTYPIMPLTNDLDAIDRYVQSFEPRSNQGTLISPAVTWATRILSPGAPFTEGNAYKPGNTKLIIVVTDGEQVTEAENEGDRNGIANQSTNSTTPWTFDPARYGLDGKVIKTGFGPKDMLTPYGFIRDSRPLGYSTTEADNQWDQHLDELVRISDAACAEAKTTKGQRNIQVMSIGISKATEPGTRAYKALGNCASRPEYHFYAQSSAEIKAAISSFLTQGGMVRLTQ